LTKEKIAVFRFFDRLNIIVVYIRTYTKRGTLL